MKDSGLFALCGIPGSGKTLNATYYALKHYKKENRLYKKIIAYIKYRLKKNKIYNKLLKINNKINIFYILYKKYINYKLSIFSMFPAKLIDLKILNKKGLERYIIYKISSILLKLIFKFFEFVLLLYAYVRLDYISIIIVLFVFFRNKILSLFDTVEWEYIDSFPCRKINNVYSNYPILLDHKRNIYSNIVTTYDLNNQVSFLPNSIIIIDEVQLDIDSDEYRDKKIIAILRRIGKYLQSHRHFGIENIYFCSQGVTRIFKKARDVCAGYVKYKKIIHIPLLPLGLIFGTIYYDIDYFGKYIPKDKEEKRKLPFDYKKIFKIINLKKVYSSYDSRYLANANYSKPLISKGTYNSLKMDESLISSKFDNLSEI